jgi:enoyl-CoA hydratase/carnithine racemase
MLQKIEYGEIVELRLHRPPANALDPELISRLDSALSSAASEGAAAIVISGTPGMFTGGLDLITLSRLDDSGMREAVSGFLGLLRTLASCPVPLAAAITGHSPAGGAVISQFCDHRVMARGEFTIGFSESQLGIAMPRMIFEVLALRVGWNRATELCLTGRLMGPEQALAEGLLDQLAEPEDTVRAAITWLEGLVRLPHHPLAVTRQRARSTMVAAVDTFFERDVEEFLELWNRPETRRAVAAMVQRLTGGR